jgi:hypothetical protein
MKFWKWLQGEFPDITPAQLVAGVPVIAGLLHAFGVYDLSAAQSQTLSQAVLWAMALIGGDAVIRVGRNVRHGLAGSPTRAQRFARLQPMAGSVALGVPVPVPGASFAPGTTITGHPEVDRGAPTDDHPVIEPYNPEDELRDGCGEADSGEVGTHPPVEGLS